MDPYQIDANDKTRAKGGSLRSPDFRRMVRLTWPHRRFIAAGLLASVVYGLFHSVSVLGVLPVLKVILAEEGFHGWVYRTVAQERLGASLELDFEHPGPGDPGGATIKVLAVGEGSPLAEHAVAARDRIVGTSGDGTTRLGTVATVARAEGPLELHVSPPLREGQPVARPKVVSVAPLETSWEIRLLRAASRLVPEESRRNDRVVTLACVLGFVVAVVLLSNVARFIAEYYTALGVLRGVMDLRRSLYSKVLRLPMDFFTQNVADIVTRFVQDAQEIQRGLVALFGKVLREPIRALFLLIAALYLDARLTLTMLLVAPVAVVIFWHVGRKIRKANKRLLRTYGLMIGALGTTLGAIGIVKAYNAENIERQQLWQIDRRMFRHQMRIAKLEAFLKPMLEVLAVAVVAVVTVWLGAQVIDRQIELEKFATLVVAIAMLSDPLRKVADVYPRVMRSAAGARRIFSVVDAPAENELLEGATTLATLSEAIEYRGVTFSYPQSPEPAIREVSITVKRGETVAIVGPNGSGKTTLTKMLLRFHDPQAGQVLFDGLDIRQATLRSLRRQISLVTQDPVLFALSIAENIAYGSREADRARIIDAARRAHAEEFILEKAGGYDEPVGERGTTLSGGQRQRLCIARAILKDAPILIFDEATSQIDSESERQIQESLADLARGRTTFIVAHRLSTIRFASRIIVMDQGRIVDSGPHEELIARCPLYSALCQTQLVHTDVEGR